MVGEPKFLVKVEVAVVKVFLERSLLVLAVRIFLLASLVFFSCLGLLFLASFLLFLASFLLLLASLVFCSCLCLLFLSLELLVLSPESFDLAMMFRHRERQMKCID